MHKVPVGVLGASGYAGRELCRLVIEHPHLTLAFATANEQRGQRTTIAGQEIVFSATEDAPLSSAKLVFSALPHGKSRPWVERASGSGAFVVDLSQDMRPGTGPAGIPYGLPELNRRSIPGAKIVANPGCYPTAILVALAPLVARNLVKAGCPVSVVAASGVTGAGSSPKPELLFAEIAENYRAYAVGNAHRHMLEVRSTITDMGGGLDVVFTPHLLPVKRGILATITVSLRETIESPSDLWRAFYEKEQFVQIVSDPPSLKDVVHRNSVRVSVNRAENVSTPTLIVIAAIDNLMKGAAGQAVQNANILLGFDEAAGLRI